MSVTAIIGKSTNMYQKIHRQDAKDAKKKEKNGVFSAPLQFYLASFLLLVLSTLLVSCSDPNLECNDEIGCVEIGPNQPVRIAVMLPVSGPAAFLGQDAKKGVEFAIADQNGELLAHPIELVMEDAGCRAETGQLIANKIATHKDIVGVIGTVCSTSAETAVPIINEAGLVMISPANSAPGLTEPDPAKGGAWQPGYFRTAYANPLQARTAAEYAYNELGARTAATIHDGTVYAESLQQAFVEAFQELGGGITFRSRINVGQLEMVDVLTDIGLHSPDVLYLPIFEPEMNVLVNGIVNSLVAVPGLENTYLIGADSLFVESFPPSAGVAVTGMYLSGTAVTGTAYDEFLARWNARFNAPPPAGLYLHAYAYDAVNILFTAITEVVQVNNTGALLIGRQALRDAVAATVDFDGLTGTLVCSRFGDCASETAVGIYRITEAEITDGQWPPQLVWTPGTGRQ